MMNSGFKYLEIEQLNQVYLDYQFTWKTDRTKLLDRKAYYPCINFSLAGQKFELFVDDEFDDLKKNYPLLVLCLVLRELEGYEFTPDYERWCQERFFDPNKQEIKDAYTQLKSNYKQIKNILGCIESFVSDFDFELNAGAAQRLRKM